jgi:hypothetical protein
MTKTTRETTNTQARFALVASAVISTMLVWLVAALLGLEASVTMNGTVQSISGISVALTATVAGLGAWTVKAILDRLLRNPTPVWMTISVAVGLLSLAGPLTMATAPAASAVLVVMHLVPAAILIPGLARTGPRTARTTIMSQVDVDAASQRSGYGGTP